LPTKKDLLTYSNNSSNRLKCPHCRDYFIPKTRKSIYCCREHKDKQQALLRKKERRKNTKTNKDRISKKFILLKKSSFGLYIYSQIKRSGTVEILRDFNSQTLHELYRIKRMATSFSGYKDGVSNERYHLSHIFSAKGNETSIGTIHPENLVIAPADWNFKHKSIANECTGKSISKSSLSPKWKVKDSDSIAEVLGKARAYLGSEFNKFISGAPFPSQKEQLRKKLSALTKIPTNASLADMKELATLHGVSSFSITSSAAPVTKVLKHELERFNETDHWTYWLINQLYLEHNFESLTFAKRALDSPDGYTDYIVKQALNLLHGCTVSIVFEGKPAPDYFAIALESKHRVSQMNKDEISPLDLFCITMDRYQSGSNLQASNRDFF
jgi:hypothetical protein